MEDIIVTRYLFDLRPDGQYVPRVSIEVPEPQAKTHTVAITDFEGRAYRDLNRALQMDF